MERRPHRPMPAGAPFSMPIRPGPSLPAWGAFQGRPPHSDGPWAEMRLAWAMPRRPPKPPLKREAARRSRDGGFLPPSLSAAPTGDEKPPVTAFGGDSPLFKGAWTIRLTAPGPFVGALPRPARILHPAPGHCRGEAFPIGRTRATVPARGRQQAGESPFDFDAPNGAAPAIGSP